LADRLTPEQRILLMSKVRSRDMRPGMAVRKMPRAMGFCLHRRPPGTPDVVLPRRKAVVLVSSCFFHVPPPSIGVPALRMNLRNPQADFCFTGSQTVELRLFGLVIVIIIKEYDISVRLFATPADI